MIRLNDYGVCMCAAVMSAARSVGKNRWIQCNWPGADGNFLQRKRCIKDRCLLKNPFVRLHLCHKPSIHSPALLTWILYFNISLIFNIPNIIKHVLLMAVKCNRYTRKWERLLYQTEWQQQWQSVVDIVLKKKPKFIRKN